jgi:hypothetical protein
MNKRKFIPLSSGFFRYTGILGFTGFGILFYFGAKHNSNIGIPILVIFIFLGLIVFQFSSAFESIRERLNKLEEQKKESE